MGIPLIRLPVDPFNILHQVFESHVFGIVDRLPIQYFLPRWTLYVRRGWQFEDKASTALRLGKVWATVTPVDIYVQLADPEAIDDVLTRRHDFPRPTKPYELLEVFGPCISTATGDNWARHRKILAAPFNENIMTFVWAESVQQAKQMLGVWTKREVKQIAKNTRTLSLNVLAATGFNKPFRFESSTEEDGTNGEISYRDALQTILDNCISLMIFRPRFLSLPFLPDSWKRVGRAAEAFKQYMVQMLEEEMSSLHEGKKGSGSLMTSLVRAGENYFRDSGNTSAYKDGRTKGLTVDEIFGNIFVINFAGHDTTANTLSFSILLLAAHPEIQEWVAEEVKRVTAGVALDEWEYSMLYPKLIRCRAVMLEILRLYPPVLGLGKRSNAFTQPIHFKNRTVMVPPETNIYSCVLATQTHPDHFPDPLNWNPQRWISSPPHNEPWKEESLIIPRKGTFLPWAEGPQICPGTKFSQVEFVAVIACMMREHRITLVKLQGESAEEAKKRVLHVTKDCDMQLLLRMKNADRVQVRCERLE
jgi:cytochrome P450